MNKCPKCTWEGEKLYKKCRECYDKDSPMVQRQSYTTPDEIVILAMDLSGYTPSDVAAFMNFARFMKDTFSAKLLRNPRLNYDEHTRALKQEAYYLAVEFHCAMYLENKIQNLPQQMRE